MNMQGFQRSRRGVGDLCPAPPSAMSTTPRYLYCMVADALRVGNRRPSLSLGMAAFRSSGRRPDSRLLAGSCPLGLISALPFLEVDCLTAGDA